MEDTVDWTGRPQNHIFASCSGAQMVDMAKGQMQYAKATTFPNGQQPEFVTMTIGGNNAHFANVAGKCIFHNEVLTNWLPLYENETNYDMPQGECGKAMLQSRNYIYGIPVPENENRTLEGDLDITIGDMLQYRGESTYYTYVPGYAHFFNTMTDYCDNVSFDAHVSARRQPQMLVKKLRTDLNDLTTQLNIVIERVVNKYRLYGFRYVSVTEGFDGHRFCEAAEENFNNGQYFSRNVFFWNLSLPNKERTDDPNNKLAAYVGQNNDTAQALGPVDPTDPRYANGGQGFEGFTLRPFHPTKEGHCEIKRAIWAQLLNDPIANINPLPEDKCYVPGQQTAEEALNQALEN